MIDRYRLPHDGLVMPPPPPSAGAAGRRAARPLLRGKVGPEDWPFVERRLAEGWEVVPRTAAPSARTACCYKAASIDDPELMKEDEAAAYAEPLSGSSPTTPTTRPHRPPPTLELVEGRRLAARFSRERPRRDPASPSAAAGRAGAGRRPSPARAWRRGGATRTPPASRLGPAGGNAAGGLAHPRAAAARRRVRAVTRRSCACDPCIAAVVSMAAGLAVVGCGAGRCRRRGPWRAPLPRPRPRPRRTARRSSPPWTCWPRTRSRAVRSRACRSPSSSVEEPSSPRATARPTWTPVSPPPRTRRIRSRRSASSSRRPRSCAWPIKAG